MRIHENVKEGEVERKTKYEKATRESKRTNTGILFLWGSSIPSPVSFPALLLFVLFLHAFIYFTLNCSDLFLSLYVKTHLYFNHFHFSVFSSSRSLTCLAVACLSYLPVSTVSASLLSPFSQSTFSSLPPLFTVTVT